MTDITNAVFISNPTPSGSKRQSRRGNQIGRERQRAVGNTTSKNLAWSIEYLKKYNDKCNWEQFIWNDKISDLFLSYLNDEFVEKIILTSDTF
jgi:hypothetical protein